MPRNPFQQLYNGEKMAPKDFIQIFSTELIKHAMPLFQPGHVVRSAASLPPSWARAST